MIWDQLRQNPFGVLGIQSTENGFELKVLNHYALSVSVLDNINNKEYLLNKDMDGFFQTVLKEHISDYSLKFIYPYLEIIEKDPYSFPCMLSDYDLYLFNEGNHRNVWDIMGAHQTQYQDTKGVLFTVWAPNAKSVRLTGDFNFWDKERFFMRPRGLSGVWEIFLPELNEGYCYKYIIEHQNGTIIEKADPYASYSEIRPKTASVIYNTDNYQWNDHAWMDNRTKCLDQALSIYECHLDSWLRDHDNKTLTYVEIALPLAEYVKEHGFTHIELMPVAEYPFDGSWGYQVTGYYAPTARYGTPKDFMFLVDHLHQNNIGIIIDWVPAHFPYDEHGLAGFDGTALYEHEDPRLGWHHDWNTHIFNYGRNEVRQFLIGSALYWIEKYHIDGLRVDAVASMLYLDYSRKDGEWIPNKYGGRENLEAIEFLQSLHHEIELRFPSVMTIAEESTSFPGVTAPTNQGGLGFTYKWNMGWMNDTLEYFGVAPSFRPWHHQQITFSLIYAFSEHYILPFSHDEVVHGKGTLLTRMPGSDWEKFANLRLMYSYMWAHPGKKLLFHGQEWGAWEEWSESMSIPWHLNHYALHNGIRRLVKDLNLIYRSHSALYQLDKDPSTFTWINCDDSASGLLIWVRKDSHNNQILTILNLNTVARFQHRIGVLSHGTYQEILNTDKDIYAGAHICNEEYTQSDFIPWQEQQASITINIGPLACLMFKVHQN